MKNLLEDKNIKKYEGLSSSEKIKRELPVTDGIQNIVLERREQIERVLEGKIDKKIIITGPCSIHNSKEALDYAKRLKRLQDKVDDKFILVMRTYFEKPRTSIGWKGLIYDPDLDGSNKIEKGLRIARKFLLELAEMGIPAGTEFLGPLTPQYIGDLISWIAIGARTSESQPHREMASGLSTPVGFKNDTSGNVEIAVNSIRSAKNPHSFIGIDNKGKSSIVHTKGNDYCHLILRGGEKEGECVPNYEKEDIDEATKLLEKNNLPKSIIVDCSHGNSGKNYKKQPSVFDNAIKQMKTNPSIKGLMLESYLKPGNQDIGAEKLECGVSVTDGCMGWETTEQLILKAHRFL